MLAPPSLQNEYTLCYSGDPALDLPAIPAIDRATATAEAIAEANKAIADREQKLKVARERGSWDAITKPGQKPTVFRFRQVGGTAVRWWFGESERQRLSGLEDVELMFRLALVGIDGIAGVDLKSDRNGKFPLVSIATMDAIYARADGPAAVTELGTLVAERAIGGVPPL